MTSTDAELAAALEWARRDGVHGPAILAEFERLKLELKRTKESLDCAQENFSVTNTAYIKRDQVCQLQAETIRETNKEVEALKARLAEARNETLEEGAKELDHRAFLCHAHDDFGKGKEKGLLDGVRYVRALKRTEGET